MKLLIVIANYRVTHLTIACLRSIAEEIATVPDTHVAICENGTGDDAASRIQKAIDHNGWSLWCSLTTVTPNLGFTGGNNVILRPALQSNDPPQYVLLLNADTIVRANAFKALADFMDQHPEVGIAGSRLEDLDGTPQRSAFRFHSPLSELEGSLKLGLMSRLLKQWIVAPPPPKRACETDWVSGASMIVRREVWRDVGVLDEGYYTYFEDIDFCFNARKAGWPIWYVPASRVMHLGGQSTGISSKSAKRQPAYSFQARRRYFLKNHGKTYAAMADAALILGLTLWRVRALLGEPDCLAPYFLRDTIRNSVFITGFELKNVQNPILQVEKCLPKKRNSPRQPAKVTGRKQPESLTTGRKGQVDKTKFGVVTIGRNEGERLKRSLQSAVGAAAIVYVDSGSKDGSERWARHYGCSVVELDMDRPFTAARARNAGFGRLQQIAPDLPYVQFLDGDCELVEGWAETGILFLDSHDDIAAVCGRLRERHPERSIYNWLCDQEWDRPAGEVRACAGNVMMRVTALSTAGCYREDVIAAEEDELCVRLRCRGWRIWRLESDMALHDASMNHFGQWWKRAVRSGYGFAQGTYLHGASPERHFVWESRRAWFWGIWLPFICLVLSLALEPWGWGMWLIYPLQILRQMLRNPGPLIDRALLASFQVIARFPESFGQIKFLWDRLVGREARLIEYK
jgi:N-acetylglucosaminyl-diphospho-decaprenol L-rhamnosyltransferase